jgi:hypothetical protein
MKLYGYEILRHVHVFVLVWWENVFLQNAVCMIHIYTDFGVDRIHCITYIIHITKQNKNHISHSIIKLSLYINLKIFKLRTLPSLRANLNTLYLSCKGKPEATKMLQWFIWFTQVCTWPTCTYLHSVLICSTADKTSQH